MVKYSSSVLAAANLLVLAQAAPAQPVCSVIVQVVTGYGVWVPQPDPTWGSWVDPSSKSPAPTTTASWGAWGDDPSKNTKTTTKTSSVDWNTWDPSKPKPTSKTTTTVWGTWDSDPSKNTKTTTKSASSWGSWTTGTSSSAKPTTYTYINTTTPAIGGGFYSLPTEISSTTIYTPTTTDAPSTTSTTTDVPTTTSTTTQAPAATSCPYYDGSSYEQLTNVQGGGSCDSSFTVNCGARVNVPTDGSVKFWERHDNEFVGSLADCIAICDDNTECTAAIWTDYAGAGDHDKNHCWQTNGLPQPSVFGGSTSTYGQISYKGSSDAQCSLDYTTAQ